MSTEGTTGTGRHGRTAKRLGVFAFIVVGSVAGVELKWHPISTFTSDRLYDNVSQYASCDAYSTPEAALRALESFPRPAGVEALIPDRCGGRGSIDFQYGSHIVRVQLESALKIHGTWHMGTGWFLHGVPVELRNV